MAMDASSVWAAYGKSSKAPKDVLSSPIVREVERWLDNGAMNAELDSLLSDKELCVPLLPVPIDPLLLPPEAWMKLSDKK